MKPYDEHPGNGRRRVLQTLAVLGIGLHGALRVAVAQTANAQGVRRMRGTVSINGKPAAEGSPVRPGDTVVTGRGGLAVFVVGSDAFLMRDNSRLELEGTGLLANTLRLVSGKLLGVFAAGAGRRIVTATATVGIRGTGSYQEAEPERTYFCLCYGTADVAAPASKASETFVTRHHESPRFIYGDGRSNPIVPADVDNHTDSELIMLEALVGRTAPKEVMEGPYMNRPYPN